MIAADERTARRVTDGAIALQNLEAQIEVLEAEVRLGRPTVAIRVDLIELITLRGLFLGRIADYERAEEMAEGLVREEATDGASWLARARARALFHRFRAALDDLAEAERFGLHAGTTNRERAAIYQALGRYEEARALLEDAADRRGRFEDMAAMVGFHAERGDRDAALRLHRESLGRYRGVSPFPLALLDFQLGLMWMNADRWDEARTWFNAARRLVPAYRPAQGHLAEVEAELGDIESAVARLHPLATTSDDPDYAGQLARILGTAGRAEESRHWCRLAAARFDDLIARHPEAYADHAAEFWLGAGADPDKALRLARLNVEVRDTPRARRLLAHAIAAAATAVAQPN